MDSERKFMVTGTQVYGTATANSDIDIVMEEKDADILVRELLEKGIEISKKFDEDTQYRTCFYFSLGVISFNIIQVANRNKFDLWRKVTESMCNLPPFESRKERLKAFHSFVLQHEVEGEIKC